MCDTIDQLPSERVCLPPGTYDTMFDLAFDQILVGAFPS